MGLAHRHNPQGPGRRLGLLRAVVLGVGLALVPPLVPVFAQDIAQDRLPVLTLDIERLFAQSLWGQRLSADLERDSAALSTENNRIADDLIAEEKSLTERRASLPPEAFRAEAKAFDARATGIRNAQNAKSEALAQGFDAARGAFFAAVAPLMDEVLARRGGAVLLDRRVVIRGLEAADITADLVALADQRLGAGPGAPGAQPQPSTPPAATPAPAPAPTGTRPEASPATAAQPKPLPKPQP